MCIRDRVHLSFPQPKDIWVDDEGFIRLFKPNIDALSTARAVKLLLPERSMFGIGLKSMPRGAEVRLSLDSAIRWPATGRAVLCIVLSLDRLPALADTIDALRGM